MKLAVEVPAASALRLTEIAEVLASGLMRALARKSSRIFEPTKECSLDISVAKSAHPTRKNGRGTDD